jgi:hypothetical protein
MVSIIARLSDRLLAGIVPNTTAGACPCGDAFCSTVECGYIPATGQKYNWWYKTNCNCEVVHRQCNCPA